MLVRLEPELSSRQLVEECLGLFQIARVKPLGEPAVDRSEKLASLIALALIAPETRHVHRGAQFQGFCLLLTRKSDSALEIRFRFRRIRLGRLECYLPDYMNYYGFLGPFLGFFHCCNRLAAAPPSVIVLAKVC